MSSRARPHVLVPRDAALLLLWPVIMGAFAAQLVFSAEFPWSLALHSSMHDWLPWMLLSPIVWWVARRFPLERGRLRWSVPIHIVACAATIAAAGWLTETTGLRPSLHRLENSGTRNETRRLDREATTPPPALPGGNAVPPNAGRPRSSLAQRRLWTLLVWARTKLDLPVYWIVVSVAHALAFYRRAEERHRLARDLEARLSEAKLEALRLQLQPHFLFNTLNAISTLVHRDPDVADEMIANLSQLLRLSLETQEQEVPLRRELELLDRYLEIEQVRLGERLKIDRFIDASALDALVPSLLLQPLVENAVRHGIEPRSGPGTIRIAASRQGTRLVLEVEDNGLGLQPASRRSERRGIGLANSEARLRGLHGNTATIELREPAAGGVIVHLELPVRSPSNKSDQPDPAP